MESEKQKVKESYVKWFAMIEELKWQQACEEHANFEKACEMALSLTPKSEEEYKFIQKYLFWPQQEKKKIKVPDYLSSQLK